MPGPKQDQNALFLTLDLIETGVDLRQMRCVNRLPASGPEVIAEQPLIGLPDGL